MGNKPKCTGKEFELGARSTLLKNKHNEKIPVDAKFSDVREGFFGFIKLQRNRYFFVSLESMSLFFKSKNSFNEFRADGVGLPLYKLEPVNKFGKVFETSCLIYRYELKKGDELPHGEYKLKGTNNGFSVYKVLYCVSTHTTTHAPRIETEFQLEFINEPGSPKFKLLRPFAPRDLYVLHENNILYKWEWEKTTSHEYANTKFTIRDAGKDAPYVPYGTRDFQPYFAQSWGTYPIIGFFDRPAMIWNLKGSGREHRRLLLLGENDLSNCDPFSPPWHTQRDICFCLVLDWMEQFICQYYSD